MRTLVAAGALALGFAAPASALTTISVDDFNLHDQFAYDLTGAIDVQGPSGLLANGLQRTISHLVTTGPAAAGLSWVTVGPTFNGGAYSVVNDPGFGAQGSVSWLLPASFVPPSADGSAALKFDVQLIDLNATASLYVGPTLVAAQNYSTPGIVSFDLSAAQQDTLGAGALLRLVFTGAVSYDTKIDNVRLEVTPIPEAPTSVMMLAGLLALIGWRRQVLRAQAD